MSRWRQVKRQWQQACQDDVFLKGVQTLETFGAKLLSMAMMIVIGVSLLDLFKILFQELTTPPYLFLVEAFLSYLDSF